MLYCKKHTLFSKNERVLYMNDISFYKSFSLSTYLFHGYRHTDNSHGIGCHYLAKMISGRARFVSVSGDVLEVACGDVFYLPRGLSYHSYWYGDGDGGEISWLSISFRDMPIDEDMECEMQKIEPDDRENDLLLSISSLGLPSPQGIAALYAFLARILPKMAPRVANFPKAFGKIIEYMKENKRVRVPQLARYVGISESGLYALVKKRTGLTPIALSNRIKAYSARDMLLSTGMTVEEIAAEFGFESVGYFRKIFKSAVGMTLLEVRKGRKLI